MTFISIMNAIKCTGKCKLHSIGELLKFSQWKSLQHLAIGNGYGNEDRVDDIIDRRC